MVVDHSAGRDDSRLIADIVADFPFVQRLIDEAAAVKRQLESTVVTSARLARMFSFWFWWQAGSLPHVRAASDLSRSHSRELVAVAHPASAYRCRRPIRTPRHSGWRLLSGPLSQAGSVTMLHHAV